jgi:C-terminal processing protease CtpA/Prc
MAVAILVTAAARTGAAASIEEVCRLVQSQGMGLESNAARVAAIEGMLKAVDPEARILAADQVADAREGPSVDRCEEWPEGIGYVRVTGLRDNGGRQIATQLVAWAGAGRAGAIVDTRGAGGASLSSVEELAGLFMQAGQPLYRVKPLRGKTGEPRRASRAAGSINRLPVMLLVDDRTRDACALLAAALKGRAAVMLIGAPTRPEPRVREFIRLSDGEAVFMATGWVVEAAGADLPPASVTPDVVVDGETAKAAPVSKDGLSSKPPSEKAVQDRRLMEKVSGDVCLARATDILLGLKAVGARRGMAEGEAGVPSTNFPAAPANSISE